LRTPPGRGVISRVACYPSSIADREGAERELHQPVSRNNFSLWARRGFGLSLGLTIGQRKDKCYRGQAQGEYQRPAQQKSFPF
jgi:hypothetical protein